MTKLTSFISALLLSASALFAFDGEISMETVANGQTVTIDLVAKGDKVKVTPPGGQGTMIIDAGSKEMIIVMDAQRMFMKRPLTDMQPPATTGKLEDGSETRDIMGYEARKVIYTEPGGKKSVIWATTELKSPALTKMPGIDENMLQQLEEVFGTRDVLPLETTSYRADGTVETTMKVSKIAEREVADSEVTPPADYDEFQMPDGMPAMPQPGQ